MPKMRIKLEKNTKIVSTSQKYSILKYVYNNLYNKWCKVIISLHFPNILKVCLCPDIWVCGTVEIFMGDKKVYSVYSPTLAEHASIYWIPRADCQVLTANIMWTGRIVFSRVIMSNISFLTMEYWNQTLQYFLEARGILYSTLCICIAWISWVL